MNGKEFLAKDVDPAVIKKIPAKFALQYKLIPVKESGQKLVVAMVDPDDLHALDDLRLLLGEEALVIPSPADEMEKALRRFYGVGAETMEKMVEDAEPEIEIKTEEVRDIEKMARDASIIQFVNQIVVDGYHNRATDIHLEPFADELKIRYRTDGVLHEASTPAAIKKFQSAIISRIKIMANLNIAEKRFPQDGRISLTIGKEDIDVRVSIIPTLFGESVDLRILPSNRQMLRLNELGLSDEDLRTVSSLISSPHGIILETGPTGCGKTTSLYACLGKLNSPEKKIITIEDPIEYQLKGVNQMQINPKVDLTFANGLRYILRQDPDVIMVGEIRDLETAQIAIRASLTGHLVLSTLHTNDAPGAITRLLDMGIEPYLVSSSLRAVIAQRLVRIICPNCRQSYKVSQDFLRAVGFPEKWREGDFYRGEGCDNCQHTGYRGRTGIYEILLINDELRDLIVEKIPGGQVKQKALETGMKTLRDDGFLKVRLGETTIDEVLRTTHFAEIK